MANAVRIKIGLKCQEVEILTTLLGKIQNSYWKVWG